MKAVSVFDQLPDLQFYWSDDNFIQHVKQTVFQGNPDVEIDDDMLVSLINEFFAPIIPSYYLMKQQQNQYTSMIASNGAIYVMAEFADLLFVAICTDGTESEWFLQRKLKFLSLIFRQLFGPSINLMKPQSTLSRQRTWLKLRTLFKAWQDLCSQEQIFLVEALERLHVNQTLNSNCLGLLEDILSKANRDSTALHALILVNNKLLGLYSSKNAPELHVVDILLLTVFSKAHYKYEDQTVPISIHRTPPSLSIDCLKLQNDKELFKSSGEKCSSSPIDMPHVNTGDLVPPPLKDTSGIDSSPGTDFHSAESTPIQTNEHFFDNVMPNNESYHTPMSGSPTLSLRENVEVNETISEKDSSPSVDGNRKEERNSPLLNGSPSSSADSSQKNAYNHMDNIGFYHQEVLSLRTPTCPYMPHTVHFIRLDDFTVLLLIFQFRHGHFASLIHRALTLLSAIINHSEGIDEIYSSPQLAKCSDAVDVVLKRLIDGLLMTTELHSENLKIAVRSLESNWSILRKAVAKMPSTEIKIDVTSNRIAPVVDELRKALKSIFSTVFLSWKPRRTPRYDRHVKTIEFVRELSLRRLRDFSSYLQVRGHRNVTMTAYHNEFPGLVHFIYINRTTDLVIAPSINGSLNDNDVTPLRHIIKQRIWDYWQYSQYHMNRGYTTLITRDGDFVFSYYLWFEDVLGKPLPIHHDIKMIPDYCTSSSVMGDDFYRKLTRKLFPTMSRDSIFCFEMICVHVGVVSNRYVVTSCKKLTELLWEASGEANSPIGLL